MVNKKAKHQRAMGSGQWKKLRLSILDRDGRICYACGNEANEVDHIWPRSKGGDMFDPQNCAAICRACNLAKGDRFFSPTPTPPVFSNSFSPKTAVQVVQGPCEGQPSQDLN